MSLIVGIMLLGMALIMIEIFIPGGVVGAIGGIALLAGVVMAFRTYGAEGGIVAFIAGLIGVFVCLYIEFKIIPKTPLGRKLFLQDTVAGKSQPDVADLGIVGKEGEALTALAPSGYVLVEGKKFEATSRSGFLDKGEAVKVVSLDQFKLTVSKI